MRAPFLAVSVLLLCIIMLVLAFPGYVFAEEDNSNTADKFLPYTLLSSEEAQQEAERVNSLLEQYRSQAPAFQNIDRGRIEPTREEPVVGVFESNQVHQILDNHLYQNEFGSAPQRGEVWVTMTVYFYADGSLEGGWTPSGVFTDTYGYFSGSYAAGEIEASGTWYNAHYIGDIPIYVSGVIRDVLQINPHHYYTPRTTNTVLDINSLHLVIDKGDSRDWYNRYAENALPGYIDPDYSPAAGAASAAPGGPLASTPTTPARQAAAATGAAAVLGLSGLAMHAAQNPITAKSKRENMFATTAVEPSPVPDSPPVNEKGQVYYKPPWETGGAYWMDPEEYRHTREMMDQGRVWSDTYGWQDPGDLAYYEEQQQLREQHTQERYRRNLQEQAERRLQREREGEIMQDYLEGRPDVNIDDIEMSEECREALANWRERSREIWDERVERATQKIEENTANAERYLRSAERYDRLYYTALAVEKTCDVIIDQGTSAINKVAPGAGTKIQLAYNLGSNVGSSVAEDGFSTGVILKSSGEALYDTASGVLADSIGLDDAGLDAKILYNTVESAGSELLFGDGDYEGVNEAAKEAFRDTMLGETLDFTHGERTRLLDSRDAVKVVYEIDKELRNADA